VHSIVPAGHVTLSVPFDPVGPCTPVDPDMVLSPHASAVWFVPFGPEAGVFSAVGAYDAVSTDNDESIGTLAVVANIE